MSRRKSPIVWLIILVGFGLTQCDMGTQPKDTGDNNPPDTSGTVSYSQDVQPIFTNNCAFSGCHGSSGTQQNLVLEEGVAYDNIVSVPSQEMSQYNRIEPGKPDSSYLYLKINPSPPSGSRMPQGGPYLSDSQISTIENWVIDGAKDN